MTCRCIRLGKTQSHRLHRLAFRAIGLCVSWSIWTSLLIQSVEWRAHAPSFQDKWTEWDRSFEINPKCSNTSVQNWFLDTCRGEYKVSHYDRPAYSGRTVWNQGCLSADCVNDRGLCPDKWWFGTSIAFLALSGFGIIFVLKIFYLYFCFLLKPVFRTAFCPGCRCRSFIRDQNRYFIQSECWMSWIVWVSNILVLSIGTLVILWGIRYEFYDETTVPRHCLPYTNHLEDVWVDSCRIPLPNFTHSAWIWAQDRIRECQHIYLQDDFLATDLVASPHVMKQAQSFQKYLLETWVWCLGIGTCLAFAPFYYPARVRTLRQRGKIRHVVPEQMEQPLVRREMILSETHPACCFKQAIQDCLFNITGDFRRSMIQIVVEYLGPSEIHSYCCHSSQMLYESRFTRRYEGLFFALVDRFPPEQALEFQNMLTQGYRIQLQPLRNRLGNMSVSKLTRRQMDPVSNRVMDYHLSSEVSIAVSLDQDRDRDRGRYSELDNDDNDSEKKSLLET